MMSPREMCAGKRTMYMSFVLIPLAVVVIAGMEDKTAWFFNNGHRNDYAEDYQYRFHNNILYGYGLMVSHYSAIVVISIVGILISWIVYEGVLAYKKESK